VPAANDECQTERPPTGRPRTENNTTVWLY